MDSPLHHRPVEDLLAQRAWISALAGAIVGDSSQAEDVAQDAWVTALERPPTPGPRLRGWLRRVVRSRAVDAARSNQRRRLREEQTTTPREALPAEELVLAAQLQGAVARAVLQLAEPYRLVVLQRYFEDTPAREIAARLDVPLATIRTRLHRAHAMLRSRLAGEFDHRETGWRSGLLLLAQHTPNGGASVPASITTGVVAVTLTQKIGWACACLLLGLAGGWLGAYLAPAQEPSGAGRSEQLPMQADGARADDPHALPSEQMNAAAGLQGRRGLRTELDALRKTVAEMKTAGDGELESRLAALERFVTMALAEGIARNESITRATSRNVISASAQFQQSGRADQDADGTGEYGGFIELSGAGKGRMAGLLVPPVLSRAFRTLTAGGAVRRAGYYYRIFLPARDGSGVGEPGSGFAADGSIDADLAETTWCMYAWPVEYGVTGKRTFMTNQGGDVLSTDAPRYSGPDGCPPADAAFAGGGGIVGRVALGVAANDGNTWKQVG